jgi:amino acid transporter
MARLARIVLNAVIVVAAGFATIVEINVLSATMALVTFTVQSNNFALLMAAITLLRELRHKPRLNRGYRLLQSLTHSIGSLTNASVCQLRLNRGDVIFKGMSLTAILLTFVIFNFVLRSGFSFGGPVTLTTIANDLLHVVVPLLMLADYLVFERKGSVRAGHPFVWLASPAWYLIFTACYKALGGVYQFSGDKVQQFPYFFLDYETYGLPTVLLWVVLIAVGFVVSGFLLYAIDRILARGKDITPSQQQDKTG